MSKEGVMRKNWVDIAKGIVMLLVCVGHTRLGEEGVIASWICSFHMSFFFLIAGYCFDEHRYTNFSAYAMRKCRSLGYPYLMLSLLVALLFTVFYWKGGTNFFLPLVYPYPGSGVLGFWFVRCLFGLELLYGAMAIFGIKWRYRMWVSVVLCVLGFTIGRRSPCYELYCGLIAIFFYAVGEGLRRLPVPCGRSMRLSFIGMVMLLIQAEVLVLLGAPVASCYGNIPPFAFIYTGISGSLAIAFLSLDVDRWGGKLSALLSYIGRNSLLLLALHPTLGVCRRTWIDCVPCLTGPVSMLIDFALIAFFMWLVPHYLGFFIKLPEIRRRIVK